MFIGGNDKKCTKDNIVTAANARENKPVFPNFIISFSFNVI